MKLFYDRLISGAMIGQFEVRNLGYGPGNEPCYGPTNFCLFWFWKKNQILKKTSLCHKNCFKVGQGKFFNKTMFD